jgi:AraC-like DNA-binding protein
MTADEGKEHPWDMLEAKKYLIPCKNQDAIYCPTCYKFADVGWMNIKGRGDVPYASCVECGFYEIDPRLLRTWMIRLETILERLVEQLELRGGIQVHVPNLLWRLGRKKNREYLYIRSYKPKERRTFRNELSKMPNAVLVTGTQLILENVQFDHDHASFSLESVTRWDEQCELVIDFDALQDILGEEEIPDKKPKSKPTPKGSKKIGNTEKLIKELEQFLKDAREHAIATADRGDIDPLPRPTRDELAQRTGLSKWAVSRCFNDDTNNSTNTRYLNLLWEQANDLKSILR